MSKAADAIRGTLNVLIDGINLLIKGINAIPGVPNIGLIPKLTAAPTPGGFGYLGDNRGDMPTGPAMPSMSGMTLAPPSIGGSTGGRSGGTEPSAGGGSGPSFSSLGLALDLSNYQPPADFLAGYDPFAGMGFTINVNGGLATSAEIGNAVVDAIKQYTNVSGPADIAIR
jgi:hypothetical protein